MPNFIFDEQCLVANFGKSKTNDIVEITKKDGTTTKVQLKTLVKTSNDKWCYTFCKPLVEIDPNFVINNDLRDFFGYTKDWQQFFEKVDKYNAFVKTGGKVNYNLKNSIECHIKHNHQFMVNARLESQLKK